VASVDDTLTGNADVDEAIRRILGLDDEDDDSQDEGDWAGLTAFASIDPVRFDAVNQPASGDPFLVLKSAGRGKSHGGAVAAGQVVKAEGERRFTLVRVYAVNRPDRGVARDGRRDFAPAEALQDAAWSYLSKGGQVGVMHRDHTEGAGRVVESFLWPADDWVMTAANGATVTIRKGDWMAGVIWDKPTWAAIKSGTYTGVSMQGTASRRKPTAQELASLHKSAARPPRCGKCQKKAKRADARFCARCGAPLGVAKSAAALKAEAERAALAKSAAVEAAHQAAQAENWAGWLLERARSGDPAVQARALGQLDGEFGEGTAVRLMSGELTPQGIGSQVAKSAAAAKASECKTCRGGGRLRHPRTGKRSRVCPSCKGSGRWTPGGDDADISKADADLIVGWGRQAKAAGERSGEAIGYLSAMLGPDVAARLVTGMPVSPGEMRRAYLAAGRAGLSAAPGQEPRIPQATHVAEATDFRRPPVTVRQSRPAPASAWPGSGGQWDSYAPGPGIDRDPGSASYPLPGLAASSRR
jgi:hypothetical protein